MSSEKKPWYRVLLAYLLTGAIGTLLFLSVLMGLAYLISREFLPTETSNYYLLFSAALAGFCARKLTDNNRGEGALSKALFASLVMALILMLFSSGINDHHLHVKRILSEAGAYAGGDLLGSMVRINKKYSRKHNQGKKYYN